MATRNRTTRRVAKRRGKSVVTKNVVSVVTGAIRSHFRRNGVTATSLRQVQNALVSATRVTNAVSVVAVRRAVR